tara:strand:- start:2502 stop:3248 length:747 start_codon:yes stop_codon:yes gene_type:complete
MKIQFFSSIDGVAETYPIVKTSQELPKWTYLVREDFKKQQYAKQDIHLARCPGIFHMFAQGFIIPAWNDFEIECNGEGIKWTIAENHMNDLLEQRVFTVQSGVSIGKYLPKRPWSIPHILKYNTPWHVITPKNVKMLMLPLPYTEDFDLECCPGILEPAYSSELNIQMYWNKMSGKRIVKAGTPLAQLIPLTEKEYSFEVRDKNENDTKWLKKRKYLNAYSFIFNRNKAKEAYHRQYHKLKGLLSWLN